MKKLEILKNILRLSIDDIDIDYEVYYNITGKVYEVKPLLLELPLSAQYLLMGKNMEATLYKIEDYKNLIRVMLPLSIVNQNKLYNTEFTSFIEVINQKINDLDIPKKELYEYAKKGSLEHSILSSVLNLQFQSADFNPINLILMSLFSSTPKSAIDPYNVQYKLIRIYCFDKKMPRASRCYILRILKHFSTEKTINEGLRILKDYNNFRSNCRAAKILIYNGYSIIKTSKMLFNKWHSKTKIAYPATRYGLKNETIKPRQSLTSPRQDETSHRQDKDQFEKYLSSKRPGKRLSVSHDMMANYRNRYLKQLVCQDSIRSCSCAK